MRFTKETTRAIRKWLKTNNFNCTCKFGKEMCYFVGENKINVPHEYSKEPDKYFMRFLRQNGLNKRFNPMTMSILHELGHCMTEGQFTEDEWIADNLLKMVIGLDYQDYEKALYKYWKTDTEFCANKWAIFYATTFPNKTKELEKIIMETIDKE